MFFLCSSCCKLHDSMGYTLSFYPTVTTYGIARVATLAAGANGGDGGALAEAP
jgi:hypothetical protein